MGPPTGLGIGSVGFSSGGGAAVGAVLAPRWCRSRYCCSMVPLGRIGMRLCLRPPGALVVTALPVDWTTSPWRAVPVMTLECRSS